MKFYSTQDIKKLRKSKFLTQKELANNTGVSQSLIAKIEKGLVNPSYDSMIKLINYLEYFDKKKDISCLVNKKIYFISRTCSIKDALEVMKEKGVSQLPVLENGSYFGVVTEKSIIKNFEKDKKIEEYVDYDPPIISLDTSYDLVGYLLKENEIVLVKNKNKIIGIISRQDWFDDQYK